MDEVRQDAKDKKERDDLLDNIWAAERKLIALCERAPFVAAVEAQRDHSAELRQFKREIWKGLDKTLASPERRAEILKRLGLAEEHQRG